MTSPTNSSTILPTSSARPIWPFDFFERLLHVAPDRLDQPINQGWTFGNVISVTEVNSSAPDTERKIVAAQSYGRQLGRVIDAVAALISDLPESKQQSPAFAQLVELRDKIDSIKAGAAARRLDRFATDLVELRKTDRAEYRRIAEKLQTILGEGNR